MTRFILQLIASIIVFSSFGQGTAEHTHQRCAHDQYMEELEEKYPGYQEMINKSIKDFNANNTSQKRASMMITIPVHVILVHAPGESIGSGSNFTLDHVQSQIDVLNEDFGRYNNDAGNTPPEFPAADTGIQFCLATVDPNGDPSEGVTRHATTTSMANGGGRTQVISETRWPRDQYMNIWSAPGLPFLGLATVPGTGGLPGPNNDFVLVEATAFGGPGYATFNPYNLGRTATHEVGHWLGLGHVWGGGCGSDDGIDDTPNQSDSNFGCPNHPSPSCGNSGDMFMNYMDYVNDDCMNAFTSDQGDYMNLILSTSRSSLLGSDGVVCVESVPLTLNVLDQQNPTCAENFDGSISVEGMGGEPTYTYELSDGQVNSTGFFSDLPGGFYTVTITDSNNASLSVDVILTAPDPLLAQSDVTQSNTCPNDQDGVATIMTSGGTQPYSYSINNEQSQSSPTFDNLANGVYTYQIVDANGCFFSNVFELSGNPTIIVTIDSLINNNCAGDSLGLVMGNASGGAGSFTYSINGLDYQPSGLFENLSAGTYFFSAADSQGCGDSTAVLISAPDSVTVDHMAVDITCNGDDNGMISITSGGGTGPILYSINGAPFSSESELDSLSSGDYSIIAQDSLGCMAVDSASIVEPAIIEISPDTVINTSCYGEANGSATFSASGGTGDLTYTIGTTTNTDGIFNNYVAGEYELIVEDANECQSTYTFTIDYESVISASVDNITEPSCANSTNGGFQVIAGNTEGAVMYSLEGGTPQSEPTFDNLGQGEYTIIISDETGCDAAVFITLTEPEVLQAAINVDQNVSCANGNDGAVTVTITGGTQPYSYQFDNGMNGQGLSAGEYTLEITDNNGCTELVPFMISEPLPLIGTIESTGEVDCTTGLGGTIVTSATGGNGSTYDFALNGQGVSINNNDGTFADLAPGPYTIDITDELGCTSQLSVNVTTEGMFAAQIESVTDVLCFGGIGGSVSIDISGGQDPYTYELDGAPVDISNLNVTAGEYTLSAIDGNGCQIDFTFEIGEPTELVLEYTLDTTDDILTLNASGGTGPYSYSFDGGITFGSDNMLLNPPPGDISVVISDNNGCLVTEDILVTNIQELNNFVDIKAFPNPIDNQLVIQTILGYPQDISIQIFDLQGKVVHNISKEKYQSGENFVKINASNFASSIYIVKIASAEDYRFIKVIKM